ncbi:MAG: protease modulator HflC, partial [Lachnospiraceae bacterium]|nr:protease modulator HflC [Lachnospiraceae bacterium]
MGKTIKKVVIIAVACLAVLILFGSTAYTVHPNESAIVIRLGRIQNIQSKTGLHFRVPFIDTVNTVYTGDILYDIPTSDVITSDKKS